MTRRPAGRGTGVTYGLDIGGTKVLGIALDADGAVIAERRAPTPQTPAGGETLAESVRAVVIALRHDVFDSDDLSGPDDGLGASERVGLGVPGMLDARGVLQFSAHLGWASGVDLSALVSERLSGMPVYVSNDANCAAIAELSLGAARGVSEALVVTLGTGIGGALVVGRKVWTGAHGFAGEIGHMVVDPGGPPCPCGRRGCWERFASGGGLARLAREAALAGTLHEVVQLAGGDPERVSGEHVTASAAAGDPAALRVVEELGWWLALGLANLVAAFDPELVVVGGGLAQVGEMLLEPARRAFGTLVEGGAARGDVRIVAAELGTRSGAIGAALAARGS